PELPAPPPPGAGAGAGGPDASFAAALDALRVLLSPAATPANAVPKGGVVLLRRGASGALSVFYEPPQGRGKGQVVPGDGGGRWVAGTEEVGDERVARALWLCYLVGGTVASEEMRRRVLAELAPPPLPPLPVGEGR